MKFIWNNDMDNHGFAISQVHLVIHHLAEYIEMEGMACGLLCEQAGESVHSDFQKHWAHYAVKDIGAVSCGTRLFNAVTSYNSNHL